MAGGFTKEQAVRARNADLGEFLLRTDPEHYVIQGNSVRLCDPSAPKKDRIKAISIKRGVSWAYDFKTGRAMNAVQYLTDYMGYGLVDAIKALAGDDITYRKASVSSDYARRKPEQAKPPPIFPEKATGSPRQMYAYLCSRGIPAETITSLCRLGLLYQSKEHNNLVFINGKKDYAELRGTYTYGQPFHGVLRSRPDRFWSFAIGKPQKAYVCESAIDAISLYTLLKQKHQEGGALYAGIGGVANQQSIDLIKKHLPVILAVDNDPAGQLCRDRNPDCAAIIPSRKDWNEDLLLGPLDPSPASIDAVLRDAEKKSRESSHPFVLPAGRAKEDMPSKDSGAPEL